MSDDLPQPLTPPECDLRGLEWMPLYGHRLFASDFDAHAGDSAFRAALSLWWSAWNQVPAASLPDDEVALCRLAGLGRDLKTWRAVRTQAMHGFVRCADGRLYHRAMAPIAVDSFEHRRKERTRRLKWKEKSAKGDVPAHVPGDDPGTADRTRHDTTGHDTTGHDTTGHDTTGHNTTQAAPQVRRSANGLRQARAADLGLQASTGGGAARRLKPQAAADRDMVRWLTDELGIEGQQAWMMVIAARDPEDSEHERVARQLEGISREHRLGWFADEREAS
ncbi:MAG: DUF1376 domain-containing protein [Alphaproteobacteria bacterium]|nr:DUF1376 domain-containing protein [Alphaproteobacteria bacterium]MCW5743946.1 DUF1376 domain-containing protein [Alphaproteobacteria bacterium]